MTCIEIHFNKQNFLVALGIVVSTSPYELILRHFYNNVDKLLRDWSLASFLKY